MRIENRQAKIKELIMEKSRNDQSIYLI